MNWFFNSWSEMILVLGVGVLAYVALVLMLRVSGKRTLSKMNGFDLVVTVALGSTLATIILSKNTSLSEGILAMGSLIFLQYAITWLSVRSKTVMNLVKNEPTLLVYKGNTIDYALKKERITHEEIFQALRAQNVGSINEVHSVVLETDGNFSIIRGQDKEVDTTRHVKQIRP